MKTITETKYVANDGTKFSDECSCEEYEYLVEKITEIENLYLHGPQNQKVQDNEGYFQHSATNILLAWDKVITLSRPYFKSFENLKSATASEIHPMGFGGRIISECAPSPLNKIWWRFGCIDKENREWQQPYYALNEGKGKQVEVN